MTAVTKAPQPTRSRPLRKPPTQAAANRRALWFLLLPSLVPVVLFSVYPLLNGIWLGFTDAQAGYQVDYHFNGLDNYVRLLRDDVFWNSFKIGLIWAFSVTILQFLLSLGLALLLNAGLRFQWLVRPLALVPWARPSVIVVGVWAGMPQTTVTLLAGLQNTPYELHEAAALDGANGWQRFRTVTWPALRPIAIAITSLDFVWHFNSFGLVYVLTEGGPGGRTQLPMLFAYQRAFGNGEFGYAAALGNAMVIVIMAIMGAYLWRQLKEAV